MDDSLRVYFAGDLFNHKDLVGNLLLAEAIGEKSDGRFQCVLPQNMEQTTGRSIDIRNQDLLEVMRADLLLLNFDGTELDSGTVVEFIYAKSLDIPCVILRSDFRSGGDEEIGGNPWNLMCSGYPRTEVMTLNGMAWYQESYRSTDSTNAALDQLYQKLAVEVIARMEEVLKSPPLLPEDPAKAREIYRWGLNYPGRGVENLLSDSELDQLISAKRNKIS